MRFGGSACAAGRYARPIRVDSRAATSSALFGNRPEVGRRAAPAFEEPPRVRRLDPEAEPFAELARQTLADLLERMEMPAEITLDATLIS